MRIMFDTDKDKNDQVHKIINILFPETNNQAKLQNPKTYKCNNPNCKKTITKDVVAFCLHEDNRERFHGKVYCRDCQQKINTEVQP